LVKKLIVYDLDGTLAESKSPLDAEMAALLHALLGVIKGGGNFRRQLATVLKNSCSPIFP